jgi:hypothetical protein
MKFAQLYSKVDRQICIIIKFLTKNFGKETILNRWRMDDVVSKIFFYRGEILNPDKCINYKFNECFFVSTPTICSISL